MKNKKTFFKWVFSKWSYYLIAFIWNLLACAFSEGLTTLGFIGSFIFALLFLLLPYLIFWKGAKSKLSKELKSGKQK